MLFRSPSQWYNEGADIFDVEIERQTFQSNQWSSPEVVSVLPGHLTFRQKLIEESIDAMERDSIIRDLRGGRQGEVSNPEFYLLKGFKAQNMDMPATWDGDEVTAEEDGPTSELLRELQKVQRQIQRKRKSIATIEKNISDERSGGGRGGGGSPLGGGGPGGGRGGSDTGKLDLLRRQLEKANLDLIQLLDKQVVINEELDALETDAPEGTQITMSGKILVLTPKNWL